MARFVYVPETIHDPTEPNRFLFCFRVKSFFFSLGTLRCTLDEYGDEGLLFYDFIPEGDTRPLRTYNRHVLSIVNEFEEKKHKLMRQ